jgi:prepilin-type N-terminal cleavage/methylation domain-containing protein
MRRGFSLLEMLVVLGLLMVMSTVAFPIARWTILNMAASQTNMSAASRLDNAVQRLRQDVWQAESIDVSMPQTLLLTCADGHQIRWQFGPGDSWGRNVSSSDQCVWTGIANKISCTAAGSVVVMTVPDSASRPGGTICFVSQAMLYRKERS